MALLNLSRDFLLLLTCINNPIVSNIYIGNKSEMRKSYKGLYKPTNPKKYVDTKMIVYRSLLERRFMRYCDLNEDILFWASEELPIRYYSPLDKKYHRYFPDFVVKTVNGDKYMIEIKPSRQVGKPKRQKKTKSYMRESFEYIKNQVSNGLPLNNIVKIRVCNLRLLPKRIWVNINPYSKSFFFKIRVNACI